MASSAASDDELECRICRAPEEPGRPLFHPCKCSGSIKHTHEDCLVNWLSQSGTARCELCHHPFRFEPLYQPNTPRALPANELVLGLLSRARSSVVTVARISLVLIVWLFLLPLGTCWTWYALFINSLGKLPSLIASRGVSGLVTDAFYGCLLSAGIVFVFLGVSSLRDYIRHLPDDAGNANPFHDDRLDVIQVDSDNEVQPYHLNVNEGDAGRAQEMMLDGGDTSGDASEEGAVPNNETVMPLLGDRNNLRPAAGRHGTLSETGRDVENSEGRAVERRSAQLRAPRPRGHMDSGNDSDTKSGHSVSGEYSPPRENDIAEQPRTRDTIRPMRRMRATPHMAPPSAFSGSEHGDRDMGEVEDDSASGSSVVFDDLYAPDIPGLTTDEDDEIEEGGVGGEHELGIAEVNRRGEVAHGEPITGLPLNDLQQPMGNTAARHLDFRGQLPGGDEDVNAQHVLHERYDVRDDAENTGFEGSEDDDENDDLDEADEMLLDDQNEEGGALFGLFELDPDEVPLEEMVGLRGHLRNLFDNAGTVLVSNAIFLGIFTLIPLLVGRLALRLASLHTLTLDLRTVSVLLDPRQPLNVLTRSNGTGSGMSSENELVTAAYSTAVSSAASSAVSAGAVLAASSSAELTSTVLRSATPSVVAEEPLVSYVDNLFVVLLGYGCISLCAFGYVIMNSLLRSRYPRLDTPMTRQVVRVLRYMATFVKIVVLILFEFGIFPLGCGWWLDVCTLDLVNADLASRTSVCREFPWTCTAGHWFLGIVYMVHISLFVSLLREVLRPELLWFLRDPDDPDFRPFRELVEKPLSRHARRMCLSVLIYAPLIVAIVYVPAQVCLGVLPQVFPFNIFDFSHSLAEIPFGNLLVVPLVSVLHHARPGAVLRAFVKSWTQHVSTALGIEHIVLKRELLAPVEEEHGLGEERFDTDNVFAPFDNVDGETNGPAAHERENDRTVGINGNREPAGVFITDGSLVVSDHITTHASWVRGLFMLFCGWITMVIVEVLALTVPTVVGRSLLGLAGMAVSHDLYAFGLGLYVLLGTSELICRAHKFLSDVDAGTAIQAAIPYALVVLKGSVLAGLWFGVAPLGAGLLVELMVTVPLRVAPDESPYFYLLQDWALGLLLFKVWARIVLVGGFDTMWRERLERARAGGLLGVGQNFRRTIREVVGPVLVSEAVALAVPYSFAYGVLRHFGVGLAVASYIYRNIYVWVVCIYVLHRLVEKVKAGIRALHDSIRDDKYLVGRRLYNYSRGSTAVV